MVIHKVVTIEEHSQSRGTHHPKGTHHPRSTPANDSSCDLVRFYFSVPCESLGFRLKPDCVKYFHQGFSHTVTTSRSKRRWFCMVPGLIDGNRDGRNPGCRTSKFDYDTMSSTSTINVKGDGAVLSRIMHIVTLAVSDFVDLWYRIFSLSASRTSLDSCARRAPVRCEDWHSFCFSLLLVVVTLRSSHWPTR